jgi:hypothetical protein
MLFFKIRQKKGLRIAWGKRLKSFVKVNKNSTSRNALSLYVQALMPIGKGFSPYRIQDATIYRVAAIFPEQLQSFADALKIFFFILIVLLKSVSSVCRNVNRNKQTH